MRMPNFSLSLTFANRSADSSMALVGMQPQLRHVPPMSACSTRAVRSPSWPARKAAE